MEEAKVAAKEAEKHRTRSDRKRWRLNEKRLALAGGAPTSAQSGKKTPEQSENAIMVRNGAPPGGL